MGGEGRPESLSSLWDAFVGSKDNGGTGEPDPSNQIAGFDVRLNLFSLTQIPVGLYAQYVGEDEAGGLPAKKMYLAGIDYSASLKNMPYQVYAEWADTRTNGKVQGISYNHTNYTDGFYQHGYPLAHALGGDGDIRIDFMNRLSGRILLAEVNQSERAAVNNAAFAFNDEIKALDLNWSHYIRPDMPLKFNVWVSNSEVNGQDGGASLGIEIPLEKGLFKY